MRTVLLSVIFLTIQLINNQPLKAQQQENTRLFRLYEDNDFLNWRGKGTDDAYTNGTRLDVFYTKSHPSRFIVDRNMPTAGDSAINVFGWGLMQVMFTPQDITQTAWQPNDYPYAGGLFATHSLYSYNPRKKYSYQTELLLGVMGPASFAKEAQIFMHRLIHYKRPMGWDNQLGNDPLINIGFTAEKQFAGYRHAVEVIGGAQVYYGTLMNGVSVYPLIRIGKMQPYFNGYLSQFGTAKQNGTARRGHRLQAYFIIKPEAQLIFTNALLEGGMFSSNTHEVNGKEVANKPANDLQQVVFSLNFGAVVSAGRFSISFIQNSSTAQMKGSYSHEVGNLSMYYSW